MAKEKMMCPISKGMCVDCAIYRGRHYYLCFAKGYHGSLLDSELIDSMKQKREAKEDDKKFGIPDEVLTNSKWIHNVEELIERRGL